MNVLKVFKLLTLTMLTIAIVAAVGWARTADPLTVIAAFDLTGSNAVLDGPSYKGAQLAAQQVNASGGVLGHPIELIAVDTAGDIESTPSTIEAALSEHPNAIAGIGYSYSTDALAAGWVFQTAGLPFITPGATAPDLPERVGDNMFLAAYGDDAQAQVMARYAWDELGLKQVALWIDDSRVYTKTVGKFFDQYFRQLGGTVHRRTYDQDTTDFEAFIDAFEAANPRPEAIYVASTPGDAATIIAQVREAGIDVPLLSGDGWDDADVMALSEQQSIQDLYFTTHRFLGVDTPEMTAFVDAYQAEYGTVPPNAFAPLGFDSLNLLADAIARAGSATPSDIRAALAETQGFPGVVGAITYQPGQRVPEKAVAVIQVDNGTETPIWTWSPEEHELETYAPLFVRLVASR
jgi:branched-chain amino acid transport system substrate-binding protein